MAPFALLRTGLRAGALLSTLAVGLLAARVLATGAPTFGFLLLNLALAWVPVMMAAACHRLDGRAALLVLGVWLAFLPNAPYIVTDIIHLRGRSAPLWFDATLLVTFALTGLFLGAISMELVYDRLRGMAGSAGAWLVVAATTPLVGLGVYLGRFVRWNSWDLAVRPDAVLLDTLGRATDPGSAAKMWAVTAVFAAVTLGVWASVRLLRGERTESVTETWPGRIGIST